MPHVLRVTDGWGFLVGWEMRGLWCAILKKSCVCGLCYAEARELPIQVFTHGV